MQSSKLQTIATVEDVAAAATINAMRAKEVKKRVGDHSP
jgi:hypothetical protein